MVQTQHHDDFTCEMPMQYPENRVLLRCFIQRVSSWHSSCHHARNCTDDDLVLFLLDFCGQQPSRKVAPTVCIICVSVRLRCSMLLHGEPVFKVALARANLELDSSKFWVPCLWSCKREVVFHESVLVHPSTSK